MTKEEIIQNIKTRISTIESYHPEEYALNQGNLFELKDLLLMIEKDEPSISSNLEDAADNHIRKVVNTAGYSGWYWTTQDIADAFKAGAEWMAEQMK